MSITEVFFSVKHERGVEMIDNGRYEWMKTSQPNSSTVLFSKNSSFNDQTNRHTDCGLIFGNFV